MKVWSGKQSLHGNVNEKAPAAAWRHIRPDITEWQWNKEASPLRVYAPLKWHAKTAPCHGSPAGGQTQTPRGFSRISSTARGVPWWLCFLCLPYRFALFLSSLHSFVMPQVLADMSNG
jgi:hypothetical protein